MHGFIRSHFEIDAAPIDIVRVCLEQYCVSYKRALQTLLDGHCCVGLFDFSRNCWRTVMYMNHWDRTQRIMVGYKEQDGTSDRFRIIDFPVTWMIMDEPHRFHVSEVDLRHCSNVPAQSIDEWVTRSKQIGLDREMSLSLSLRVSQSTESSESSVSYNSETSESCGGQTDVETDVEESESDGDDFIMCNV